MRALTYDKFNSSGLTWRQNHTLGYPLSQEAKGLFTYGDSNVVAYGKYHDPDFKTSLYIGILNNDGSLNTYHDSQDGYYQEIKEGRNGDFVVLKQHHFTQGASVGILSPAFHLRKSYFFANYWARDVIENIDTSMIITLRPFGQDPKDALLLKIIGSDILTRTYGGTNDEEFRRILPTRDTGYIALGLTNSNDGDATGNHGKFDIWVVKFRQDTSVHPLPPPVVTSVNEVAAIDNITVYPNPTQGQVRVTLPPACASVQAAVYNMVGQPLSLPAARAGNQLLIDLSLQPAGMYQLELMIGHERKSYRVLLLP